MAGDSFVSVTDLTAALKGLLEREFRQVNVEGEISNARHVASGHRYFTLKDETAVIGCVLFRGSARDLSFEPADGELVRVSGSVSVYPPQGRYQIIVRGIERAGTGEILAMLERRKRAFEEAGLFTNRRPIPRTPASVAFVTSRTGAAIRDAIQVLVRRRAPTTVRVVPVPVQGDGAAAAIAAAIGYVARYDLARLIVVTRGGGAIEDLLPFSDERVVRAIHESPIPVISAVGHEIDWALSDFAADLRAPTPSAAAELACRSADELAGDVRASAATISAAFLVRYRGVRQRTERLSVDEIRYRYRNFVQPWYQRVDDALTQIQTAMNHRLHRARSRLELSAERVESSSPFLILDRGYAIVRKADSIVTRAAETAAGDRLVLQFADDSVPVQRSPDG